MARLEAPDGPQLGLFAHVEDEDEDEGIWLVKPSGEACGWGIAVVKGWEALDAEVMARRCSAVVVQKYVERPLTLRPQGRKFDLRLWVLVTSLQPLAMWEFSQCYLRVAARPMAFDAAALADPLTHLTNYAVQRMAGEAEPTQCTADEGWGRDGWWNDRHPFAAHTHNHNPQHNQPQTDAAAAAAAAAADADDRSPIWPLSHLEAQLGPGVWARVVRPRLRALVIETLTRAAPALRRVGKGFEWLGVDVLLEAEELRPWLLEVNVSPDVSHSTPTTAALAGAATRDLLRLLLDDEARAPHWGPWGDLSAVVGACGITSKPKKKVKKVGMGRRTLFVEAEPAARLDTHLKPLTL